MTDESKPDPCKPIIALLMKEDLEEIKRVMKEIQRKLIEDPKYVPLITISSTPKETIEGTVDFLTDEYYCVFGDEESGDEDLLETLVEKYHRKKVRITIEDLTEYSTYECMNCKHTVRDTKNPLICPQCKRQSLWCPACKQPTCICQSKREEVEEPEAYIASPMKDVSLEIVDKLIEEEKETKRIEAMDRMMMIEAQHEGPSEFEIVEEKEINFGETIRIRYCPLGATHQEIQDSDHPQYFLYQLLCLETHCTGNAISSCVRWSIRKYCWDLFDKLIEEEDD